MDHLVRRGPLGEVSGGTRLHHLGGERILGMNGQHYDAHIGAQSQDLAGRFQTADARHVHVHQDHVGVMLPTEGHGGFPALCLAHHLDPADIFQNASYPCTHQLMIIDQEYINHPNTPFFISLYAS